MLRILQTDGLERTFSTYMSRVASKEQGPKSQETWSWPHRLVGTGCIPTQVSNQRLGFFLYEVGGLAQTVSEVPTYLIILLGNPDLFPEIITL